MQVMEAEIEPPPILKLAFQRNPEARGIRSGKNWGLTPVFYTLISLFRSSRCDEMAIATITSNTCTTPNEAAVP